MHGPTGRSLALASIIAAAAATPAWAGTTERVSVGAGGVQADDDLSLSPSISADGRFVAFLSSATNLVRGEAARDLNVFVRDLRTSRTTRASPRPVGAPDVADAPLPLPAISADGRVLAFGSVPLADRPSCSPATSGRGGPVA